MGEWRWSSADGECPTKRGRQALFAIAIKPNVIEAVDAQSKLCRKVAEFVEGRIIINILEPLSQSGFAR